MSYEKTVGKLIKKNAFEEMEMYWEIPDFLSLPDASTYHAPDFEFFNISWYLYISNSYSEGVQTDDIDLWLHMYHANVQPFDVMCIFGIKKVDGSLTEINSVKHNFIFYDKCLVIEKFCSRSALIQNKCQVMQSNNLVIMCKLKYMGNSDKLAELVTLSENMKSVFMNEEFCDITLHLKDKEFKAHKVILAGRSPVFANMFKHGMSENQTGVIPIIDCDPGAFQMFLEYLYCGRLGKLSFHSAFDIYKLAYKYVVPELKIFCIDYMGQVMEVENVCDVILLAEDCDDKKLFALGQKFFNRNLEKIFASNKWKELFRKNFTLGNKLLQEMATKVGKYW